MIMDRADGEDFIVVSFAPQVVQHFDSLFFLLPYLSAAAVVV
jgi:hypothetical protein